MGTCSAYYRNKKDISDSSGTTSSNKVDLKRPDTDGGDVSNLRFGLWKSAIEIFKSKPISGGSPGYYIEYAHDKLPYTLMGKDTLTAHNFIFLVMAATGGLGLLTLLTFLPYTLMGKDTLTAHNFIFLVMAATGGLGLFLQ
ncbi:hypothetical protein EfmAA290_08850 [Enterococcus faecium]|nr:hypothetical protein EfmAA290_08850 [Enterococcus faecium]